MKKQYLNEKSEIEQFGHVEAYLNDIPQFMNLSGKQRSEYLLKELGNPEENLKIIHVAGTNGKGSVCSYLNSALCCNSYKTGLFTSPHLVEITERIQINGSKISKSDFVRYFNKVYEAAEKLKKQNIEMAYFDYLLGIAMCAFNEQNVDIVVMETGLGGKLDSTNAVKHPIASVITTISLEHVAILGDTIEKIANEKAGIIKPGVPVIYSAKNSAVNNVILQKALKNNAKAVAVTSKQYQIKKNTGNDIDFLVDNEYYKNDCFSLSTKAIYQVENCTVALTVLAELKKNNSINLDFGLVKKAVYDTHWAGRMEQIYPQVYIDGAHNPEGIAAFVESSKGICQGKSCVLLFSVVRDKNFEKMIRSLCECEVFDEYVVTQVGGNRKLDEESMKNIFLKYTDKSVTEFESVREAFKYGLKHKKDIFMCTGSLYLAGEIKSIISSSCIAE